MHDEASIVNERLNSLLKSESLLIQGAISSVLSKKGHSRYNEMIESLGKDPDDGPPRR